MDIVGFRPRTRRLCRDTSMTRLSEHVTISSTKREPVADAAYIAKMLTVQDPGHVATLSLASLYCNNKFSHDVA